MFENLSNFLESLVFNEEFGRRERTLLCYRMGFEHWLRVLLMATQPLNPWTEATEDDLRLAHCEWPAFKEWRCQYVAR